jgi:hypothetical protein
MSARAVIIHSIVESVQKRVSAILCLSSEG